MEARSRRPNVLHLAGVKLGDYRNIEDIFDEKVLEQVDPEERDYGSPLVYDSIPSVFTSLEDWPHKTNLRCWSCAFSFDGRPCFIPEHLGGTDERQIKFGVRGNFCTFNCAARYIDDMYPPQAQPAKHWQMHNALCLLYSIFTKCQVRQIKPAPRKTERREYGGKLTDEEFWDQLHSLDPKHGLRDHRPGSILPERMRVVQNGPRIWDIFDSDDKNTTGDGTSNSPADDRPEDNEFDELLTELLDL